MTLMMMNFETVAWFVMNKDDFTLGSIAGNTEQYQQLQDTKDSRWNKTSQTIKKARKT